MQERGRSVLFILPPVVIVLVLGGWWITLGVIALTILAGIEVFRLLKPAGYPALPWLGLAIAVAIVIDAAVPTVLEGSGTVLAAIGILLAAAGAFTRTDPHDGLNAWVGTVFGALYVGLLSFIVRLGTAAPALPAGAPLAAIGSQRLWILVLILSVWAYDTGAYLFGKTFGRRFGELTGHEKFLSHISPSKTYAGLIGGLVASSLVILVGLWAAGQPVLYGLLLGPIVGLAAQAGDLAESMLKRAAGAKDSSNLIPGHGGALDRVDSFLMAAPVMTLFVLTFLR
jgi:phosphatidate cytidylyltransferase